MPKPRATKEIKTAKVALEQEISDAMHVITSKFHAKYPGWIVTDSDLGIIDVSTRDRQERMTASSRVELTKTDMSMKICKGNQVKDMKS